MLHIGKSDLRITRLGHRAYVLLKQIPNTPVADDYVSFYCDYFHFESEVEIAGKAAPENPAQWKPGDAPGRWRIGFAQLELHVTDRAYYRGYTNKDGSVTVRRDRPPAIPWGASRDHQSKGDPFTYPPETTIVDHPIWGNCAPGTELNTDFITNDPFKVFVGHIDSPCTYYPVLQTNSITGQDCMLQSAIIEWSFMTLLMVMDPSRRFHELKHIYWNVHWEATFDRIATNAGASIRPQVNTRNTRMAFGPVLDGAPMDPRFRNLATAPSTPTTTMRLNHADKAAIVKPSHTW